ncbi:MAG TPA: AI-2E family transporter [Sporichthyaceae bacterium]|nr:AI-2E family transporter [Sporichthyaceae bacterium]
MTPRQSGTPARNPYRWGLLASLGAFTGYALFLAVGQARSELLLIAVALVLALGLDPLVVRLSRFGLSRPWAVTVVALTGLAALAAFLAWVVPTLTEQATAFVHHVPDYQRRLQDQNSWLGRLNSRYHVLDDLRSTVQRGGGAAVAGGVFGVGKVAISAAAGSVLLIVLTLYFLAGLPELKLLVRRLTPAAHRDRAHALTEAVCERVGGYVLGNFLTSVIAGAGTALWALVFGLPDPLLLAVVIGILDLIPIVGSTVGGALAALLGLTVSVPVALGTAGFYVAYRVLEDYLITPRVMGRTVQVNGLVTVVSLMIGGALLGIVGALLAIPVAATIKLLLDELALPRLDRAGPDTAPDPPRPARAAEPGPERQAPHRRRPRRFGRVPVSALLFVFGVLTGRRGREHPRHSSPAGRAAGGRVRAARARR